MGIDMMSEFGNIAITQPFTLTYLLYQFWHDVGDRRVDDYFLIKFGPLLTISIVAAYLIFSTYLGPLLMRNREPLELRRVIFCYNVIMVALNFKYLLFAANFLNYGRDLFSQQTTTRDDYSPLIQWQIDQTYQLFVTKFVDLFDTIFFVLRKKQNQVTVLHLYHHSLVPALYWMAFRLLPTFKPLGIFVLINCFIHVLMYSYYALASFGPRIQKYLWWKKYITILQLAQFVVYMFYASYCSLFVIKNLPIYLQFLVHIQSPIFFIMFLHFYNRSYKQNSRRVRCDAPKYDANNNNYDVRFIDFKNQKCE